MNLDQYIHILVYLFTYLITLYADSNPDLKVTKIGIEKISPCSVAIQFFVDVNNTSDNDYKVEMEPDECCLEIGSSQDCNTMVLTGGYMGAMPGREVSRTHLIAPLIDPYDRKGHCTIFLDSKGEKKRHVMRDPVKIVFNTRLNPSSFVKLKVPEGVTPCLHIDEDPLNDCQAVNCEVFYNGMRPFYDVRKKRCTKVPSCVSASRDIPETIYNSILNECVSTSITSTDIKQLKEWANTRMPKNIMIIKPGQKPEDDPKLADLLDSLKGEKKLKHRPNSHVVCLNETCSSIVSCVCKNKFGIYFLAMIIILQCCLICTMVCCKKCKFKNKEKSFENKYYRNFQDASMTTPLISTTHNETETTYQCTESSNLDKKIQWYKACQKDNAKISLSDDILSKCLNRRNWDRKVVKSEAIDIPTKIKESVSKENSREGSKPKFETHFVSTKKQGEQKIVFENERTSKYPPAIEKKVKTIKSIVKKNDNKKSDRHIPYENTEKEVLCHSYNYMGSKNKDFKEQQSDFGYSEREIKCHSYNYREETDSSRKPSKDTYSEQKNVIQTQTEKKVSDKRHRRSSASLSIENDQASAQASFSNDSIDDFLSERGELFLAGDNISKYSYSNDSIAKSSTGLSSKTSKNNLMKSVLSYLQKGKKPSPSSDPGGKAKEKDKVHLELLHMSRVSSSSSSNNEECLKSIMKNAKDSRTSL